MEGIIVNYRGSRRVKHNLQMIVQVSDVTTKDKAASLIGKKVVWVTPGKKHMNGVVSGAHGNSGALRVRFDIGMPGQSIGKKIKIE